MFQQRTASIFLVLVRTSSSVQLHSPFDFECYYAGDCIHVFIDQRSSLFTEGSATFRLDFMFSFEMRFAELSGGSEGLSAFV